MIFHKWVLFISTLKQVSRGWREREVETCSQWEKKRLKVVKATRRKQRLVWLGRLDLKQRFDVYRVTYCNQFSKSLSNPMRIGIATINIKIFL